MTELIFTSAKEGMHSSEFALLSFSVELFVNEDLMDVSMISSRISSEVIYEILEGGCKLTTVL